MNIKRHLALLTLLTLFPSVTSGRNYTVKWSAFSAGAGSIGRAPHEVTGLLGDPLSGNSQGGAYHFSSGIGNLIAVPTAEETPKLSITSANRVIVVSWPQSSVGWVLERTSALNGASTVWTEVPGRPESDDTQRFVRIPVSELTVFYRLRKP